MKEIKRKEFWSIAVSRVEYDKEMDRLVGFVLPSDDNDKGLPLSDSFMAVSFQAIENSFKVGKVA